MFKNLLQLYSLLVCLIASVVMMVTVGAAFNEATTILLVEYKNKVILNNYSTNEKYISYDNRYNGKKDLDKFTSEELVAKRVAARSDYIQDKKDGSVSSLINIFTWFLTALLFFAIHWRIYKKDAAKS
ncbi:hypothetical protein N9N97_01350 [Rickettsiaceae bacterium]|nr:hypothetical protein [Rickettsiaceae bacterium]